MNKEVELKKIIIDCDPGHDDAIAFLLAAKADDLEIIDLSV